MVRMVEHVAADRPLGAIAIIFANDGEDRLV